MLKMSLRFPIPCAYVALVLLKAPKTAVGGVLTCRSKESVESKEKVVCLCVLLTLRAPSSGVILAALTPN